MQTRLVFRQIEHGVVVRIVQRVSHTRPDCRIQLLIKHHCSSQRSPHHFHISRWHCLYRRTKCTCAQTRWRWNSPCRHQPVTHRRDPQGIQLSRHGVRRALPHRKGRCYRYRGKQHVPFLSQRHPLHCLTSHHRHPPRTPRSDPPFTQPRTDSSQYHLVPSYLSRRVSSHCCSSRDSCIGGALPYLRAAPSCAHDCVSHP